MNHPSLVHQGISEILAQLREFLHKLPSEAYSAPIPLLQGNSIGKHCRHMLEGFESLFRDGSSTTIDYENRQRQLIYEIDHVAFLQRMDELITQTKLLNLDYSVNIAHNPYPQYAQNEYLASSFGRELLYNLEHLIHHMAILRIAARAEGFENLMSERFGLAFSTLQHQQK